jgi:ankyrin repeat protein
MAYNADPNVQDMDGYTPLHLAIKSAESIKSSRIVKQLLFAGAERNIINSEGYKPIDYVKSISIPHILQDIKKALAEPKY